VSEPVRQSRIPRSGSLRNRPFERLLFDVFLEERTLALVLRKRQIQKTLWIDGGAPVECVSNLRHETLGQFLVSRGRITNAEFKDCLTESASRQLRIGEVVLERRLLTPAELGEALRQNLAYKVLECFTWAEGEFRVEPWIPEVDDAPAIQTPRVVFTGITKFVPQDRVTAALGGILERPLVLAPQTRVALRDLRTSPMQEELIRTLRRPVDAHVLFQRAPAERDELARTLYACSVMGLVTIAAPSGGEASPDAAEARPAAEAWTVEVDVSALDDETPWVLRDEVAEEYRELRDGSAAPLFGVEPGAKAALVRARYVELCRRYAPERFEVPELAPVAEMAAELLHAATSAYEQLRRRHSPAEAHAPARGAASAGASLHEPEPAPDARGLAEEHGRQARERIAGGNFGAAAGLLTLALRSDPGNPSCRTLLAYARFRESPEHAEASLETLEEILIVAPDDVAAHLFAAEIAHSLEAHERAVAHFEQGCALWERAAA
jgi:hypothetical protein